MAISFVRPYALLLIPVFILFVLYTSRTLVRMYTFRRRLILILRNTIFVLLILAISGLNIKWDAKNTTTIFVTDFSDSMSNYREQAESFLKNAIAKKPRGDLSGVVSFGDNSQVETFVSKDSVFNGGVSNINGTHTNIENALTSSISLFPGNTKKRIVLLTDGEENTGNSLKLASSIMNMGIDFKIYKIDRDIKDEVAVDSVNIPQTLSSGENFNAVVNVTSRIRTGAKLMLFNGREKAFEEKVDLQVGSNRFVFKDTAVGGGFRSYRAVIEPDSDTSTKNNEASSFTNIKDKPKVLVIEDTEGEGVEIVKMLQASGLDYRLVNAISAPTTLAEMTGYKSVITCNVSADNLRDSFLNTLELYVKDFGGGFIATGGENSFALGGYYKTTLEKVLPVNMELKGKKEIPDMAMMLIIDKSGSMAEGSGGLTKIDIAKEAAARVLDSLRSNKDEIGVIAFDDTVYKVVGRRKVDDAKKIRDDIGTIRAGGGTSILPALDEGYNELKKSGSRVKHIILLTDGQAENTEYDELIKKIKSDGITVSTVAVGQSSDRQLLEKIAKLAGGRYYYSDEFTNIPRIFAKETFMAAKAYLNNRTFTPSIVNSHKVLSGAAEGGLPELLGYIGASPKDTARVILTSDEDDPILTIWQYGLGRTVAWNSDIKGKWSQKYIHWDKNIKLWQNIINWTIENYGNENAIVEATTEGGKGTITFTDKEGLGDLDTIATIISPNMESKEIKLFPVSPGKYSSSFDIKEPGAYMVNVRQTKNGEVVKAVTSGLSIQYSPEYRINTESNNIDRLVKEAGGTYIKAPEDVYKGNIKDITGQADLTPLLLILSLLFFMADIALRRLNLPLQAVEEKLISLKQKFKMEKKKPIMKTIKVPEKKEETIQVEKGKKHDIVETIEKQTKKEKPKQENLDVGKLLKNKEKRYK